MNLRPTSGAAIVACAALGLSALFWWPLFRGGGFVGGDIYSYYIPQKVIYADDLRNGKAPLWNDHAGHGYPIVGESQTGPFYPWNLALYRLLPINAAYNANHLIHYWLAFVFMWLYARAIGLSRSSAGLAALVYTYAWFPPRSCWEWAIIGGAWMPAALWCVERFLVTRRWRFAFGLCGVLTLQLLAGHFNLAFLTLITLVPYVALRLGFANRDLPGGTQSRRAAVFGMSLAALGCAFALAAVQIGPTWELKQLSQRDAPGENHKLAHGSIPIWYWSQAVRPWYWYALTRQERDAALQESEGSLGAPTNQVEAHLYFGLAPLILALGGLIGLLRSGDRVAWIWLILGMAALFYTTGWFLGVTRHVPGFNFFQGPGRYGVITTLAVGVLAGKALDRLRATGSLWLSLCVLLAFAASMWMALMFTARAVQLAEVAGVPNPFTIGDSVVSDGFISGLFVLGLVAAIVAVIAQQLPAGAKRPSPAVLGRWTLVGCALVATLTDLWIVSRLVFYSEMVEDPPIAHLAESPVRKILSQNKGTARVYAPGANLPSVLGAAATPVYLTFGPAAYVDPKLTMPTDSIADETRWMHRAGVTHILSFTPLKSAQWPAAHALWVGFDPLLNRAWGRFREPLYLYELRGGRGRVAWEKPNAQSAATIVEMQPNRIVIDARSPAGGKLVLTDLMYPGWQAAVDGVAADAIAFEGMFRAVEVPPGPHTVVWSYHPWSVYWGAIVSAALLAVLAAVAHVRFWHPHRLNFLDEAPAP
jgi:hypothetical protein